MLRLVGISLAILLSTPAHAWEFRVRYVERVGNTDFPLEGDIIRDPLSLARRVRIQFGVFDTASGPAPAGGFVGWNVGSIVVSGTRENSAERRTPGRLAPFNFASGAFSNGNPPVPAGGDVDLQAITDMDATLGTQAPFWPCNPDGTPAPMPPPTLRGFNSYVSVCEITIDPSSGASNYFVTFSGNLIAAIEWRTVGSAIVPDCGDPNDPNDDTPGQIVYAPLPTFPQAFESVLIVEVPAPSGAVLVGVVCFAARRRRHVECTV